MTLPAVSEEWDISATGLRITDPHITIERFSELCWMLGQLHEAVRFAIGDAIIQGEHLFGQASFQAFEELHISEKAKLEYVRVAQKVAPSVRRKGVSWSHHRAVAALPPDQQREWLERVADEDISHHALREELRDGAPAQAQTCRCCGRPLQG